MDTVLAEKTSGGVENSCIFHIICSTHGAPRKPGEPPPEWSGPRSIADFSLRAAASARAVEYALEHAVKTGLIERKKMGQVYAYRVTPEHWEDAPKYSPEKAKTGEEKANNPRNDCGGSTPITVKPGRRSPLAEVAEVIENATHIQFEIDKNLSALSIQRLVEAGNVIFSIKSASPPPLKAPSPPGKAAPRSDPPPPTPAPASLESILNTASQNIHERHPAIRRCSTTTVRSKLSAIAATVKRDERGALLLDVDARHARWCATEEWKKAGGKYAKGLENWLSDGRWEADPPTGEQERAAKKSKLELLMDSIQMGDPS